MVNDIDDHVPNNVRYDHTIQSDNQTETMTFKATDSLGAESNTGTVTINTVPASETKSIYLGGEGVNDHYLNLSNSVSSNESTVMMWIKMLPYSGDNSNPNEMTNQAFVADWSGGTAGAAHYLRYGYSTNDGLHKKLSLYKEFYFSGSGSNNVDYLTDLGEVEIGEWTHVAITNGINLNNVHFQEMYVNGTLVATHSALQAGTPLAWNGVPEVQIGKDKSGSNGRIRASMMIDDYAIFPSRLSQSDIQTYMNNMTTDSNIVEEYMDFNNTSYYAATVGDGALNAGSGTLSVDSPHN